MSDSTADISAGLASNHRLLASLVDEPFLYVPNPGNAGDAAIACATVQSFERMKCRYQFIPLRCRSRVTRGKTVVFGGGGNLVPYYAHAQKFIERHHRGARRLIILPHTVRGHTETLKSLGANVEIYCRDEESLRHVRSVAPAAASCFAHDMALLLDVESVLARKPRLSFADWRARGLRDYVRFCAMGWVHGLLDASHPSVLKAFRTDVEATNVMRPPANMDVAKIFPRALGSYAEALASTHWMLSFLDQFAQVHTNRLHVAILAGLLGKEVRLFDNSYGKNRGVFQSSLAAHFSNITFHAA